MPGEGYTRPSTGLTIPAGQNGRPLMATGAKANEAAPGGVPEKAKEAAPGAAASAEQQAAGSGTPAAREAASAAKAVSKTVVEQPAGLAWKPVDPSRLDASHHNGEALVKHAGPRGYEAAVGSDVLRSGLHRFVLEIESSHQNEGGSLLLGIVDATMPLEEGASAWGLNPCEGRLNATLNARWWGATGAKLMRGTLCGRATGASVEVSVDMERNRLSFAIDGAAPVDAGVKLPDAVSAWVLLYHPGDAVRLRAPPSAAEKTAALHATNLRVQLAEQQARRQSELRAAARQRAFDAHIEAALVAREQQQLAAASAPGSGGGAAMGFGVSASVAESRLAAAEAALRRETWTAMYAQRTAELARLRTAAPGGAGYGLAAR